MHAVLVTKAADYAIGRSATAVAGNAAGKLLTAKASALAASSLAGGALPPPHWLPPAGAKTAVGYGQLEIGRQALAKQETPVPAFYQAG